MSYLERLAQRIRDEVDSDLLPDGDLDSLFLCYALIAAVKGDAVTGKDVHDAWTAWMALSGESHDSMVPWEKLDESVRHEDLPFVDAIRRAARA